MKKILKLWWSIVGWPDLPPKNFKVRPKINSLSGDQMYPRYYAMAEMFLDGDKVEEIADHFNVTRERVRQCLWKAWRELT